MARYLITGGTGFIGRHLVELLLARPGAEVNVLVRAASRRALDARARDWPAAGTLRPVTGDLTAAGLGVSAADRERLGGVDHVVHLAALYDMTATAAANAETNVEGTARMLELSRELGAPMVHHVSSVAVAGELRGRFDETMFDEGQELTSPYHRTKFEAERLVRDSGLPWRVYRPAVVVGHSRTGEMDKIDGPYYFFPTLKRLAALPRWLPLALPDVGVTNIVPVDYVAAAIEHLVHRPDSGEVFHLFAPRSQPLLEVWSALSRAAGAPPVRLRLPLPFADRLPAVAARIGQAVPLSGVAAGALLAGLEIPPEVLPHLTFRSELCSERTQAALAGTGIEVPDLAAYAPVLWGHWERRLDPDRARRRLGAKGPLDGRTVIITGASSGIGRATALEVARRGGVPLLLARRVEALAEVAGEIEAAGGRAYHYPVDLTEEASVRECVEKILADHDGVDMLVNNAGRSIRRSVKLSYDRFHDFERTMALNYFSSLRLILALLPHMSGRRFGHIVNVSSIGVQANPPRFSAYVASKAALDAFSRVAASEVIADGVSFTTVHMPLVRTPMIAPTRIYEAFPTISPDQAAALVIRALEERPKRVSTPLGVLAEVSYAVAPGVVDTVLQAAYRVFPDSTAARASLSGAAAPDAVRAGQAMDERLSAAAAAMARLLPGIHW